MLGPEPSTEWVEPPKPGGLRTILLCGFGVSLTVALAGLLGGDSLALAGGGALSAASLGWLWVSDRLRARALAQRSGGSARPARIGMGATVASDARVEPGATVEMGATVEAGAVIKQGAVVRMGATVHARAVLEAGAVVGWGAEVGEGAVLEEKAVVGAGATVGSGARVPTGTRLLPGTTWTPGTNATAERGQATPEDPRLARIGAACDRIGAELRQARPQVRALLGASDRTAAMLRTTCSALVAREQALRAECSPDRLAFLDHEREELQRRRAAATDERVRHSLSSAVEAIDDQKRQRALLATSAERLDAELTRMEWTLDGMAAQLVRLRTAGDDVAAAPSEEVLRSLGQLHDEIDAMAEALEHVAGNAPEPLAEIATPGEEAASGQPAPLRSR
jgi:carbonic anhydrase/acetyltransferase-like protein (isoleucine patch superfamily)